MNFNLNELLLLKSKSNSLNTQVDIKEAYKKWKEDKKEEYKSVVETFVMEVFNILATIEQMFLTAQQILKEIKPNFEKAVKMAGVIFNPSYLPDIAQDLAIDILFIILSLIAMIIQLVKDESLDKEIKLNIPTDITELLEPDTLNQKDKIINALFSKEDLKKPKIKKTRIKETVIPKKPTHTSDININVFEQPMIIGEVFIKGISCELVEEV